METTSHTSRIVGHTIQHTWKEGAFAGGSFKNTYKTDGSATLRCVEGTYKGTIVEQKIATVRPLGKNFEMVSWLEESGYTVSIVFDFDTMKITGLISNAKEYYPLSGIFTIAD